MKKLSNDLDGRVLRFDGVSVVSPEMVTRMLLMGAQPAQLRVDGDSWEMQKFNANVPEEEEIRASTDPVRIDLTWRLPQEYQDLDLEAYVTDKYVTFLESTNYYTPDEERLADSRITLELIEIRRRGMTEFMRTVVYVLDTFRKTGVVWGVGRGSSCACYILFILGLHAVDCVRLDVPMEEFFHD